MLSVAISTDSYTRLSVAVSRSVVTVARSRATRLIARSSRRPASMKCQPGSRTMLSACRPGEGEQRLEHPAQRRRADAARVGARGRAEQVAVERADHEPRVVGELVAHGVGGVEQASGVVGQAAGAVARRRRASAARRPGSATAAPGRPAAKPGHVAGDLGQRAEQHLEALVPAGVTPCWNSLRRSPTTRSSADEALGPLGVAAEPEQVLGGARRHRALGGDRLDGRARPGARTR